MEYAIYFEKFCLGEERYFFKPVSVVRGIHFKEDKEFLTETGLICEDIFGGIYNADCYFGFATNQEGLEKRYQKREQSDLLEIYFEELSQVLYFSFANEEERLCTISIPFSSLEEVYYGAINHPRQQVEEKDEKMEGKEEVGEVEVGQDKDSGALLITLPNLKAIRDLTSLEDIYRVLDGIMRRFDENKEEPIVLGQEIEPKETRQEKKNTSLKVNREKSHGFTLKTLRKEVLKTIVGQDEAVSTLTREIMINRTSPNARNKSHLLITGPTGTGKTEMVKTICNLLDLPYFEADATAYTKEGYVGKSVYSMLLGLLNAAGGDLEKAQKGILVIDEIDKKLFGRGDDVGGVSVLHSLYKILDRGMIELDVVDSNKRKTLYFDTQNLTIILMGAFEDLYEKKLKAQRTPIGFETKTKEKKDTFFTLTKEDLIEGGVPPEFIGRIGEVTSTHAFSEKEIMHLLTKSNISALKIQQEYFMDVFGVRLQTTYGYRQEVARQVLKQKTNARSVKPIVKQTLSLAIEDFLNGRRAQVLQLTKETVQNPRKYCVK